jgi:hypothetical protein
MMQRHYSVPRVKIGLQRSNGREAVSISGPDTFHCGAASTHFTYAQVIFWTAMSTSPAVTQLLAARQAHVHQLEGLAVRACPADRESRPI